LNLHELLQKDIHLAAINSLSRSALIFRLAAERRRKTWEAGAGENIYLGQNLDPHELLQRNIHLATINGIGRSAVPNWSRAYHGNATKDREQTEVEGTHVSVAVMSQR
jgi:hypothetical protein